MKGFFRHPPFTCVDLIILRQRAIAVNGALFESASLTTVNVDLIRAAAMTGVILLHAAGGYSITPQEITAFDALEIAQWWLVTVY